MTKPILLAAAFVSMSIAAAAAQNAAAIMVQAGDRPGTAMMGSDRFQQGTVRITSQFNFFLPGPIDESEAAIKLREQARRSLYRMMARECDLLRDTIAKDCRIESMNVNTNIQSPQSNQWTAEGLQVNGFVSTQIMLK